MSEPVARRCRFRPHVHLAHWHFPDDAWKWCDGGDLSARPASDRPVLTEDQLDRIAELLRPSLPAR